MVRAFELDVNTGKTLKLGEFAGKAKDLPGDVGRIVPPQGGVPKKLEPDSIRPFSDHTKSGFNDACDIAREFKPNYYMRVEDVDGAYPILPLSPRIWKYMYVWWYDIDRPATIVRDLLTVMSLATRIASTGPRLCLLRSASAGSCFIPNSITRFSVPTLVSIVTDVLSSSLPQTLHSVRDLLTASPLAISFPNSGPPQFCERSILVKDLLTDMASETALIPVMSLPLLVRSFAARLISFRDLLTDMAGPSALALSWTEFVSIEIDAREGLADGHIGRQRLEDRNVDALRCEVPLGNRVLRAVAKRVEDGAPVFVAEVVTPQITLQVASGKCQVSSGK